MNHKTKVFSPIILLFFISLLWAGCAAPPVKEEPVLNKPKVTKKRLLKYGDEEQPDNIYISPKDQVYVKSKAPIYLSIATTTLNEEGVDVQLKNEATTKGKSRPKPFYFEGHGKHSLVHPPTNRHKAHKREATNLFYVFVDGKPPTIKYSTSSSSRSTRKGVTTLGKPARVRLKFHDKGSGIFSKHVSLNGESYRPYNKPISLTKEGDYLLKYYALDNVGNRSKEYQRVFSLDFTPPESSYEIVNIYRSPEGEIILSPKSVITLLSKDRKAGVKGIYYKFGNKTKRYQRGVPIKLTRFKSGPKTLSFYAKDSTGRVEPKKQLRFYLDRKAPNLRFSISGDKYRRKKTLFVSGRSRVELSARDNKAGVREIRYYGGKKGKVYSGPVSFPKRNGKYIFAYSATDNVKNRTKKHYRKVVVDISAPKPRLSFKGPHYYSRKTHYIRKKTKISLSASDNLSGIKSQYYTLNQGDGINYKKPFSVKTKGTHTLRFHAVDNVNNVADGREINFFVDEQGPEIFSHFSIDSTVPGRQVYPKKSQLYLAATDEQAGVKTIYYRINKGKERVYKKPIYLTTRGNYRVKIRAVDRLGNVARKEVRFQVK